MPTSWNSAHDCAATVSIASYPSRLCTGSKFRNEPPEQPVPRMFTPT